MSVTILVIEDDPLQLKIICDTLEAVGFETRGAQDGSAGLRQLYQYRPDLVVLDVVMPGLDGWEVCERIRELSSVPVIFITARDSKADLVKGLKLGADDYLVKPFEPVELQARVEALIRRIYMSPPEGRRILRFGGGELVIEPEIRKVVLRGQSVDLTSTEYRLLLFMAERAGRILSVDSLSDALWPDDPKASVENVRWHVWRLRQKLEKDPENPRYILTERGLGYGFVAS
jgi:DNA-binding response OmpR family regulator